jgi:TolA-binding protein
MRSTRLIVSVLLLVMVAGLISSCRPRASRNTRNTRNQNTTQTQQSAQGAPSAAQVMAKTDSVLSRIGAMHAEPIDIPPMAYEPALSYPRTPTGAAFVPRPNSDAYGVFETALGAFNGSDYDRAIGLFSQIAVSGQPAELVPNAYYWMGESYYAMNRFQESLPYFEHTVKVGPQHKREIALYKLSRANHSLGNSQAASMWYQRLRAEYPRTTYASRLRNLGIS